MLPSAKTAQHSAFTDTLDRCLCTFLFSISDRTSLSLAAWATTALPPWELTEHSWT